jgi:hypothetical protein
MVFITMGLLYVYPQLALWLRQTLFRAIEAELRGRILAWDNHPESAVKVSKAAAAPLIQITAHPAYASACWRANGVMRSAVMRFFSRRSTRKRKPWKVKFCPGSGIDCAS